MSQSLVAGDEKVILFGSRMDLHSDKQWLSGSEARWGIFLYQGQRAEAKLVDWLIRVQWWEVCVHLSIILCNVEAVSSHILTVEEGERLEERTKIGVGWVLRWTDW